MVSSEPTWHVSRVQKRVSKFVNFKVQKVQKLDLCDFTDTWPWSGDVMPSFCNTPHLWAIFLSNIMLVGPCDYILSMMKMITLMELREALHVEHVKHGESKLMEVLQSRLEVFFLSSF